MKVLGDKGLFQPFILFLVLIFPLLAFAQSDCLKIHCDCSSLLKDDWKNVCKTRELKMIRQCESGNSIEGLYCTAHGPSANHLPLELTLSDVEVLPTIDLPGLYKKVAAIYWSTRKDLEAISDDVDDQKVERARLKIGVLLHNVDTLFELQQKITVSWVAYEQEDEAVKAWRDFAGDSLKMAVSIKKVGRKLWNEAGKFDVVDRKKAEGLALELISRSGAIYEQAAYGYSEANRHDSSAKMWKKAAEVSEYLIKVNSAGRMGNTDLQKLKYQHAARLFRASFHWVKEESDGDSQDSLKKAQEVFNGSGPSATPG